MNTRAREATHCPTCGTSLLGITMRIGEGTVRVRICPPCEVTWWERGGAPVTPEEALGPSARR